MEPVDPAVGQRTTTYTVVHENTYGDVLRPFAQDITEGYGANKAPDADAEPHVILAFDGVLNRWRRAGRALARRKFQKKRGGYRRD